MRILCLFLLMIGQALAVTTGYDVIIKNTVNDKEATHKMILKPGVKAEIKTQGLILSVMASDTEDARIKFEMELSKHKDGENIIKGRPMIIVNDGRLGSINTPDYFIAIKAKRLTKD